MKQFLKNHKDKLILLVLILDVVAAALKYAKNMEETKEQKDD